MLGNFGVDRMGGKKVCLLESFQKDRACHRYTESVGQQRAQVQNKPCVRKWCSVGATRWFEAGVGANLSRYWFERVDGGSRTRWNLEWSWNRHTQMGLWVFGWGLVQMPGYMMQEGRTEARPGYKQVIKQRDDERKREQMTGGLGVFLSVRESRKALSQVERCSEVPSPWKEF